MMAADRPLAVPLILVAAASWFAGLAWLVVTR